MNPNDIGAVLNDLSINLRRQGDLILFNRACDFLAQGEPGDALFLLRNAIPKNSFDRYKSLLEDPKVPHLLTEDPTLRELLKTLKFKDMISDPTLKHIAKKEGHAQLKLSIAYRLLGEVQQFKNERSSVASSPSINLEFSPFKHTLEATQTSPELKSLASAHENVEGASEDVPEILTNLEDPLNLESSTLEKSVGLLDWDELSQPPQAPQVERSSMGVTGVQDESSSGTETKAQATLPPSSLDSPQVKGRVFNTQSSLWKRKGFTPLPAVIESQTEPQIELQTEPQIELQTEPQIEPQIESQIESQAGSRTGPHIALASTAKGSPLPRNPSFSVHQSPQDAERINGPSHTPSNDLWDLSDEPIDQQSSVDHSVYSQEEIAPISYPSSSPKSEPRALPQDQPMYDPLQMDLDVPESGTPLTHIDTPIARRLAMAHHEANAGHKEIPSLSEIQSSIEMSAQRSSAPDRDLRSPPTLQEVIAGEVSPALSQPMTNAWSGPPVPQSMSSSRSLLVLLTVIFLFIGLGVSIAYFLFPFFSHPR